MQYVDWYRTKHIPLKSSQGYLCQAADVCGSLFGWPRRSPVCRPLPEPAINHREERERKRKHLDDDMEWDPLYAFKDRNWRSRDKAASSGQGGVGLSTQVPEVPSPPPTLPTFAAASAVETSENLMGIGFRGSATSGVEGLRPRFRENSLLSTRDNILPGWLTLLSLFHCASGCRPALELDLDLHSMQDVLQYLRNFSKDQFVMMVGNWHRLNRGKFKIPTFAHKELDLFRVFWEVQGRGGSDIITSNKLWKVGPYIFQNQQGPPTSQAEPPLP